MPKAKPTQVIVHRIELQETERKLAERYVNAKSVESVGKGALYIGGVVIGAGVLYVGWWTLEKVYGWMGDFTTPDWVNPDFPIWSEENRENFRQENPSTFQQALKGPEILWAILTQ